MNKIFVLYNLRDGVTLDEFAKWSREVDQVITPRQNGCHRFEVYAIEGAEDGEPRYQIVEDIEVESWAVWKETLAGDGMRPVLNDFPKYVDTDSVHLIYGQRVL